MRTLFFTIFLIVISFSIFGQGLGSKLKVGVDYFNTFSRSNSSSVQEIDLDEMNLGVKLSTNVYKGLDFGISLDIYNLWNDQDFLKRAYFYGAFLEYNFMSPSSRLGVSAAATARMVKFRSLTEYPYYEKADWSLYAGFRIGGSYQLFKKYPVLKLYSGIHFSFPTYRHSAWSNIVGNYSNINFPFLGVAYTLALNNYRH